MSSAGNEYCYDVVHQLNELLDARGTLFMMQLEVVDADTILLQESVSILKRVGDLWMNDILKRLENPSLEFDPSFPKLKEDMDRVLGWLKKINSRLRPLDNEISAIEKAKTVLNFYMFYPDSSISALSANDKAYLYLCASIDDGIDEDNIY